jgi:ribosomal protein S18 acetylase RimI-like enzyme
MSAHDTLSGRQFEGFPVPGEGYANHNVSVHDGQGNRLAGAEITHDPEQDAPGHAFVDWISTHPDHVRQGHATRLLHEMRRQGVEPTFSDNGNSDEGNHLIRRWRGTSS